MVRPSALIPALCATGALVLALLCLFAGSSKDFLNRVDLFTVNASRLGHTEVFNTSDGDGGFFSNFANQLEGDINNLVDSATADIARDFNLHDFYKAYVMDYCEGFYSPNANVTPGAPKPKQNITYCSKREALFHFDPTAIVQHELKSGVTLDDLHWPNSIKTGIKALEVASKVMFVFYCIGIAMSAMAVITAIMGVLASGRVSAFLNSAVDLFAFFALGIASAISTAIIDKAVHEINKYGKEIGVAAYKGKAFIGMTWASVALMLIASIVWFMECCAGRRRTYSEKHTTRY